MKNNEKLVKILGKISYDGTKFKERCYEDGVNDTIMWLLGEMSDLEFEDLLEGENNAR